MRLSAEKTYDFSGFTILVVDDNAYMRKILRDLLKAFSVGTVLEATDGADALMFLNDHWVDMVITDWMMEPLDGYDFIKLVRQANDSRRQRVPIILLTGHTESRRVRAARDIGATEFLAKPVSSGALYDRMIHVVEHPRPFVKSPKYVGPCRRRATNADYTGPERRLAKETVR